MATNNHTLFGALSRKSLSRYLILRRRVWYFQRAVPVQHQAALGCTNFTRSLQTSDLRVARQRRDRVNVEYEGLLANLEPAALDAWSPRGVIQFARQVRLTGHRESFQEHITRIAEAQPVPMTIAEPSLVEAVHTAAAILDDTIDALLSQAIDEYLDALRAHAVPSTVAKRERYLQAMVANVGDRSVEAVTKRMLATWAQAVVRDDTIAAGTKRNQISAVTAFGSWLVDAGLWSENHAAGLRKHLKSSTRGEESAVRAWTPAEVRKLISHLDELADSDPLRPLVRVALYSGMRREEICNLTGRDIEEVDGVTVFRVRQGKTTAAVRAVPVHPLLMDLVADVEPDAYLVPGLEAGGADGRRGASIGARFSRLKAQLGFDAALTFHGFRRAFLTRLESAGVAQHIAETLVGHRRKSLSFGTYSKGADLPVLAEAVARVAYKGNGHG